MFDCLAPEIEYLNEAVHSPVIAQAFREITDIQGDDEQLGICIRLASALSPQSIEARLDLSFLACTPCTLFLATIEAILVPLKKHENLQELTIYGTDYSNQICTTLANVLKYNHSLKQILFDSKDADNNFELQTALAMVDALKQHSKLDQFIINVECCTFEACVALIYGVKHSSLKVFRFWTTLQDDIVEVAYTVHQEKNNDCWKHEMCAPLAAALECTVNSNSIIESLIVEVGVIWKLSDVCVLISFDEDAKRRLLDALTMNTSLIAIHLSFFGRDINFELNAYCRRNLELRKLCFVLAQLAKPTDAFSSLKDANVRRHVFSFFFCLGIRNQHIFFI